VFPLASGFKAGQSANLRLALLYNTFSGSYLLLSQSWEILFLINYAVIVAIWMNGQRSAVPVDPSKPFRWIKSSDALRALAFLFLVHAVRRACLEVTRTALMSNTCSTTSGILLHRQCCIHLVSSKDVNLKLPARTDPHTIPPIAPFTLAQSTG
jgi:hypothetical protein